MISSSFPAPSHLAPAQDDWSSDYSGGVSPSSAYIVDSPDSALDSPAIVPPRRKPSLVRPPSEEGSMASDSAYPHSARSPRMPSLPDPAQFPDPYPYRQPHWTVGTSTPALSSADSSTASTRSSAYTSSGRSVEYNPVHVALGDEEPGVGVGITTDDVVQLLASDTAVSSAAVPGRVPVDQTRWSDLYATSTRSRSSSVGNGRVETAQDNIVRVLRATPSFDMGWQPADERDEADLGSEEETDEDDLEEEEEEEEEPTSAMIIAEEGRGIIVRGEDTPVVRLQVKPGTTHLLIGKSSTPNFVPSFLANTLPHIASTLLALDISANFLSALPPALSACVNLEELNIAANPLRALPVFLSTLTSLRVLIVDSTGIGTLPDALSVLDRLHTLSLRRNKLYSLPCWLCLLPSLETLLVDGNPFQGPWKALMEPLLAKQPMSPLYPPSTPLFPLPSASVQSTSTVDTDIEEDSQDSPDPGRDEHQDFGQEDEDTITPARAPNLSRAATSPSELPAVPHKTSPPGLTRTRTTPNRAYYDKNRSVSAGKSSIAYTRDPASPASIASEDWNSERELRKMKSAGELRRSPLSTTHPPMELPSKSATSSPRRPGVSEYPPSPSLANLIIPGSSPSGDSQLNPKRFASLGATAGLMGSGVSRSRPTIDSGLWDNQTSEADGPSNTERSSVLPQLAVEGQAAGPMTMASRPRSRSKVEKEQSGERSSRWGFLKKMSMGKMRPDASSSKPIPTQRRPSVPTHARPLITRPDSQSVPAVPQIDVRISTTGLMLNAQNEQGREGLPASLSRKASGDVLRIPTIHEDGRLSILDTSKLAPIPSPGLLAPSPTSRSARRRSFLPIDMSPIPIPAAGPFVRGLTATNTIDDEDADKIQFASPIQMETMEQVQRREEERAREARARALRSVMAYLRDMHDLSITQTNTMSIYGGALEASLGSLRPRRPTVGESGRLPSELSVISSSSSSRPESSVQLRSPESRMELRSGITTQTNSVATTDSGSGGEERKYKDDKAKRARIIREIVETERTYVKGLQELVDIYITPASAPVQGLGGGTKDTVVPAAERKIVFSGLDALFIFHRESFLPALEKAAAPLLSPKGEKIVDENGQFSLQITLAIAHTFVHHAAFMKMYSTYINNFENSVQRIRSWTSDSRPGTPAQSLSPSSSTAQLAGLGLSMSAVSSPGVMPDGVSVTTNAPLSSSQRKRIKQYLKRCRMNPRHSQLNLEGYLLLPVQRIPRYRLLLEDLLKSTPPLYGFMEDPLDKALADISSLATNMNEGKRESETRRKLVQWQSRIRGKFPSPLVQPHRRLIMDGRLQLTRVVRKATVSFEVINAQGDASTVQVECLSPELTPRSLIGVLCNDLLVLCRDPSDGQDPNSPVDLWAVLRMQTLPQPASVVHGNALRLVDNKAILYFDAPSTSDALTWFRAINLHIPASKS